MNRAFDERLELQLQEYEFAELDSLLVARPQMPFQQDAEECTSAMDAVVNRH